MDSAAALQKFPFLSSFRLAAGGVGGAVKNWKGIFGCASGGAKGRRDWGAISCNRSVRFAFAIPRAPRVRSISDFENRCELGKIETPKWNLTVFQRPNCGRRKA